MEKWNEKLTLLTPNEFKRLPDGVELTSINGRKVIKGIDKIDDDTRFGHMALGIWDMENHPDRELMTAIKLILAK